MSTQFFLKKVNVKKGEQPSNFDILGAMKTLKKDSDIKKFFEGMVDFLQESFNQPHIPRKHFEASAQSTIGYMFGEGLSIDTCAKWHRITGATHPFDRRIGLEELSPSELFWAGYHYGKGYLDGQESVKRERAKNGSKSK